MTEVPYDNRLEDIREIANRFHDTFVGLRMQIRQLEEELADEKVKTELLHNRNIELKATNRRILKERYESEKWKDMPIILTNMENK